jgi:glycosyltransferase involved in cell wall biosynthesis
VGLSLKVVINAFSARLGGGQTYISNLLRHIPDGGDLELLVYAPDTLRLPEHAEIKRCTTRWPTTNPVARAIWERFILPGVLRRESVDVLFCPGGTINTKPPKGCKTVTMFRNMIPFDPRVRKSLPLGMQRIRNWLLERIMLKSMALADLTIFISNHARGLIEARIRLKKAVTIPHGINRAFRVHGQQLERPKVAPPGPYLLYVSRFDVYKHHYEVVSAYAKLPDMLRQRFKLLLAGECDMPEARRVQGLVSQLGLDNQVRFLGPIPYGDLPALYCHAHLVLFASSCENCPNILLEALAAGRPVLSSNVMPMPEFCGDAVAYFSPFDSEGIKAAIVKVLEDEQYAEVLATAAVKRSQQYDWSVTAATTWQCISELAGHEASHC